LEDIFWEYNLQGGGAECKSKKLIQVATKTWQDGTTSAPTWMHSSGCRTHIGTRMALEINV
jgi:hypothetical protein